MKVDDEAQHAPSGPKALGNAVSIRSPETWLKPSEVAALTEEGVLKSISELKPLLASKALKTAEARRPLPAVWEALARTGVFHHFVPRRFGGCEFDLQSFISVMMEVGEVCPSTCWTATFTIEHNLFATFFPVEAQAEFFAQGFCSAPGVSSPIGTARRVDGGFVLNAHYKWGTGVMNADWIFGLAIVAGEEGAGPRWLAVPAREVTVLDTWYVDGMAGTGSNDIVVTNAFVPAHRSFSWADAIEGNAPGAQAHDSSIYRILPVQFLALCTTIPIVAAAKGIVSLYRKRMVAGRSRFGSDIRQADKGAAQVRVAKADLLARSAELTLRDVAVQLMAIAIGKADSGDLARQRMIAQCAHVSTLARESARTIADGAGASAHALSNPMQLMLRDLQVAASHQMHEFDEVGEQYGKALFGIVPDTPIR